MAFSAGAATARLTDIVLDALPPLWMGVNPQTADRTVTGQTDLSRRMAGLTGHQIFPRLAGMPVRPVVGWQYRVNVTTLTLAIIKRSMRSS